MKIELKIAIAGLAVAGGAGLLVTRSFAADSHTGNAQRGARIVASGTDYGVVACARCHAFDGAAEGSGAFPKLSGIPAYYLAKQLNDFASRQRDDAIMSAIARKMTNPDILDVAEYYAGVKGTPTPLPVNEGDLLTLGARLATVGDEEKRIQACEGCHGAQGLGEAPAIPPLAGQYGHYIAFQMRMWQKGYRKNDAAHQMSNIAAKLSAREIEALGLYFESSAPSGPNQLRREP